MSEERITKRLLGPSSDLRTNRWELTCPCGKTWKPTTTRLARRHEQCPRCKHEEEVDYNKEP